MHFLVLINLHDHLRILL